MALQAVGHVRNASVKPLTTGSAGAFTLRSAGEPVRNNAVCWCNNRINSANGHSTLVCASENGYICRTFQGDRFFAKRVCSHVTGCIYVGTASQNIEPVFNNTSLIAVVVCLRINISF